MPALLLLEEVIRNKRDTILQMLFYFTRVIPIETSPSSLYSLAKGIGTPVYPHWTPTHLVPKTLAFKNRLLLQVKSYSP